MRRPGITYPAWRGLFSAAASSDVSCPSRAPFVMPRWPQIPTCAQRGRGGEPVSLTHRTNPLPSSPPADDGSLAERGRSPQAVR